MEAGAVVAGERAGGGGAQAVAGRWQRCVGGWVGVGDRNEKEEMCNKWTLHIMYANHY